MKGTEHFKQTIKEYLDGRAQTDELFAVSYAKENKNLDDCITFILNQVKASGCCGMTDDEVWSLAIHYYDEDNIDVGNPISCGVVVNHKVELTEEEKAQARKEALKAYQEEEMRKIQQRHSKPKPTAPAPTLVCGNAVLDTSRSVVLQGYGDGLLHLEDSLTRAQMATILYRLLDEKSIAEYEAAEAAFTDVPADMWCSRYVSTIAKAGIVAGVGNGCFYPNDKLTWAQILTVLSRFTEPKACALQHIQYDGWAVEAVQTAVALGWIEDSADFAPNAIISRGDFMQLVNGVLTLYRAV